MPAPCASISAMLLLALWLSAGTGPEARAQLPPVPGVVWSPPDDPAQASDDLRRLHEAGFRAVRTPLLRDEALLTLADTLGLQLFQDLPLAYVPGAVLDDTLAYGLRVLERALNQARNHSSARHFGLTQQSDTSDPRACAFIERLAERLRRTPNSRSYYLTLFIEADRCAGAVDLVLLDARDAAAPARLVARWHRAHPEVPVGIGALGTWVDPSARPGLHVPHSPEAQARYLERHLRTLFADTTQVPYVFVERWRDVEEALPSPALSRTAPTLRSYGLHDQTRTPRPAFDVVTGFIADRQTTFAFPTGTAPSPSAPWATLVGWFVLVLVGGSYAASSRFRYMVPRYFRAHVFYRDSIRDCANLSPLFKGVFLFHWKEESQHAILDELEWRAAHGVLTAEERDRGVDDLVSLTGAIDAVLRAQSAADAEYFVAHSHQRLDAGQWRQLEKHFLKAYRWQYILSGASEPRFRGSSRA